MLFTFSISRFSFAGLLRLLTDGSGNEPLNRSVYYFITLHTNVVGIVANLPEATDIA